MPSRLEHVIARNVTECREAAHITQSQLAAAMRAAGYKWQTNRAAQIETLRRPVSLLEVVGLAHVFRVPIQRLLAGDDEIELPDGSMPLSTVRAALAGDDAGWNLGDTADDLVERHGSTDDLRKLAAKLDLSVGHFELLAARIWRRPFLAEREDRLGDVSDMPLRSAQTKRGHITRELVAEMQDWIEVHPDLVENLRRLKGGKADEDAEIEMEAMIAAGGEVAYMVETARETLDVPPSKQLEAVKGMAASLDDDG